MNAPELKTEARRLPGAVTAGWLMARLFLRLIAGRRRTLWLAFALLAPVGLSLWWRISVGGPGLEVFLRVTVDVLLQVFALGLSVYLGVAAVRDEVEDRTIVYLFARPVHRTMILGGKITSVGLILSLALAVVAALVFVLTVSADGVVALGAQAPKLLAVIGVLTLACLVYTSLFSLFGVLFRRPMIPALLLAFGWESLAANWPGGFPQACLMYYLKSLLGLGPEAGSMISMFVPTVDPAPISTALGVLLGAVAVFSAATLAIGGQREFRT